MGMTGLHRIIVVMHAVALSAASTAVLSLVNEAQYLLIHQASVDLIQEQIRSRLTWF